MTWTPPVPHLLEEARGGVAAAGVVVEQSHLDTALRGLGERGGEPAADAVVAEDVHLERNPGAGVAMAASQAGKVSAPLRSSRTACPPTSARGSSTG